jgi:hypothetical protein
MRTLKFVASPILAGLVLAVSLALAACGVTTTGSNGTLASAPGTPGATGSITPTASGSSGSSGSAAPGGCSTTGTASILTLEPVPGAKITRGLVTATLDHTSYRTCSAIRVTVANGLSSSISTSDHQTSCTILTLQQLVNGTWQPVGRCMLMIVTRMYTIRSGTAVAQTLVPGYGSMQSHSTGWSPGTYRIAFQYFAGSATSQHQEIFSSTFTIG